VFCIGAADPWLQDRLPAVSANLRERAAAGRL